MKQKLKRQLKSVDERLGNLPEKQRRGVKKQIKKFRIQQRLIALYYSWKYGALPSGRSFKEIAKELNKIKSVGFKKHLKIGDKVDPDSIEVIFKSVDVANVVMLEKAYAWALGLIDTPPSKIIVRNIKARNRREKDSRDKGGKTLSRYLELSLEDRVEIAEKIEEYVNKKYE